MLWRLLWNLHQVPKYTIFLVKGYFMLWQLHVNCVGGNQYGQLFYVASWEGNFSRKYSSLRSSSVWSRYFSSRTVVDSNRTVSFVFCKETPLGHDSWYICFILSSTQWAVKRLSASSSQHSWMVSRYNDVTYKIKTFPLKYDYMPDHLQLQEPHRTSGNSCYPILLVSSLHFWKSNFPLTFLVP